MSSCLLWSAVDEYGDNPTGRPGAFEFRIWYEIDYGDEDFLEEPSIEITGVDCVEVNFEGEESRSPVGDEDLALSEWLETSLDCHSAELKGVEHMAFEYSYIEAGGPDWID